MLKYIIIYSFLYACFLNFLSAQNLRLSVEFEDSNSQALIDSLSIPENFINYKELKNSSDTIFKNIQRIGYLEAAYKTLNKKNDSTYIVTYVLGKKYKYIKLYYTNADFNREEIEQLSDKITNDYFIIPFSELENTLQSLVNYKTSKGFSFARINLDKITVEKNYTLKANLVLKTKIKRKINKVIVKGYSKFPKSYLKHYVGLRSGSVYSNDKLLAYNNVLSTLGFVSVVKTPEILFKKDSTIVYLYLKKKKNNLFDGVLGLSNNENNDKLIINGYLNIELVNNLNFGERFVINYRADGNDQQNFRAFLKMPYLFKSPVGVDLELMIFKRDSSFVTTSQNINVVYQINPNSSGFVGYKSYESSNLLDENEINPLVEDYNSKFFQFGGNYSVNQNSKLFPIKSYFSLNTQIGSRITTENNVSQLKFDAILQHIFNLDFKNSIYLKNKTRYFSSNDYFINELFRFGGINSIRGFEENSIDATFYSVLNSEYRYRINNNTYINSIIDAAYFENKLQVVSEYLYSFGLGIGLNTKAGFLKFGIANGNVTNQDFSFSNTKLHFSIISKF